MAVINWYPGHMKKTRELIEAHLKLIDVVVEVLDARIPISSKNPHIDDLIASKPRIVALNKFDLADPAVLDDWIAHYRSMGISAVPINALNGEGVNRLLHEIKCVCHGKLQKLEAQGRKNPTLRAMIVGIPNVGKSSLINRLAGKNSAKVGNKPGVTRGKQWIKLNNELELFDTPGILWPKIDDERVGMNLAWTGAIKDEILNIDELALGLVGILSTHYPEALKTRFKLAELSEDRLENMELIGRKRGCIMSGNMIDYDKTARLIIDDFRKGTIGQISLERPGDGMEDASMIGAQHYDQPEYAQQVEDAEIADEADRKEFDSWLNDN